MQVVILLGLLFGVYILPVTLVSGAAVRLVFGLHGNFRTMALALVLGVPQSAIVMFTKNINNKHGFLNGYGIYAVAALSLVGVYFWLTSSRGAKRAHYWIEPSLAVVVIIGFLLSVDNWIAH